MSMLFQLLCMGLGVMVFGNGVPDTFEINTDGLQANDLIEWKGVISTRRAPAQLYIYAPFTRTRSYTVMKMQIQGARNKLAFSAGIRGEETDRYHGREVPCTLGKTVIAPNMRFRVIIRVLSRVLMVYWNGKLKFTHPLISSAQRLERISMIRIYGSAKTEVFRKLTDEDLAEELQDANCGEITYGKQIPDYCPSTNTGCRIVGGGPARPGQQPWQAAIRRKTVTGEQEAHVCGATLINDCWALTAGHCFTSTSERALDNLVLRVGDYYNRDNSSHSENEAVENSQDLEIEKVIKHEGHQTYPATRNDIALVKLRKCASFNEFVKPACLPTSSSLRIDGSATRCGISGWGATNATQHASEYPACLKTASVRVKSVSSCKLAYEDNFDQNTMLCAAGPGCADTCQGDSGGPLICAIGRRRPKFTLWGITSWGINCGEARTPGVYTRLTSYIRWLYINMKLSPDDQTFADMVRSRTANRYYCQHR